MHFLVLYTREEGVSQDCCSKWGAHVCLILEAGSNIVWAWLLFRLPQADSMNAKAKTSGWIRMNGEQRNLLMRPVQQDGYLPLVSQKDLCVCVCKKKRIRKKKNYSTEYSHVVPHHSTDSAIDCLTSQIGRDAVGLVVYGRNSKVWKNFFFKYRKSCLKRYFFFGILWARPHCRLFFGQKKLIEPFQEMNLFILKVLYHHSPK